MFVPLSSGEQLGKDIFYDDTLSDPAGLLLRHLPQPTNGFYRAKLIGEPLPPGRCRA